jgi:glutamate/tyrosine decarboxylase-like PLP-dependent enzyme
VKLENMLDRELFSQLPEAFEELERAFAALPAWDARAPGAGRMAEVLRDLSQRLGDNYPYFHPLYAGQMLKPPHPVARVAYALATWINPNNHALDGGRATSRMEKEAVAEIARMFGWTTHLGHLTSGGTMANLEALWVAGRLQPGKKVVASSQAHYTHERITGVLQIPFAQVACDTRGRMDLNALEAALREGDVGSVVATVGATAVGAVDPLAEILELRRRYPFRLHVDAAYGGYFTLAGNLTAETRAAFDLVGGADSLVIDPHKHGLQPYGCGAVLFRDPAVGTLYRHESPYTYFSSNEMHLGEITLECSRPGAAAAALWATQRLLPLTRDGEFARGLEACRRAALSLYGKLRDDAAVLTPFEPELDIVVWAPRGESTTEVSRRTREIFERAARNGLHLAVAQLPVEFFSPKYPQLRVDAERMACLRSVLMKPEHEEWVERIWQLLQESSR